MHPEMNQHYIISVRLVRFFSTGSSRIHGKSFLGFQVPAHWSSKGRLPSLQRLLSIKVALSQKAENSFFLINTTETLATQGTLEGITTGKNLNIESEVIRNNLHASGAFDVHHCGLVLLQSRPRKQSTGQTGILMSPLQIAF